MLDRRGTARGIFAAVVLVSVGVLFTPASGVPVIALPGVDKVVHAVLFLCLAVSGRWAGGRRAPLGLALLVYAAFSEVVQGLAGLGRTASVADCLADVGGLLLGLLLWELAVRRRPH